MINKKVENAGEWWKSDVEVVIDEAQRSGFTPNVSDAHTINGYPGYVPNCPSQGILGIRYSNSIWAMLIENSTELGSLQTYK